MRILDAYLQAELAGHLTLRENGRMVFQYAESWLDDPQAVALSHSLPLRRERFPQRLCAPFFGGVLPEGNSRATLARLLAISPENDFALLEAIGGECAGAVCLLPSGRHPDELGRELRRLRSTAIGDLLVELPRRPLLAGTNGYRMSLAGAQHKIALVVDGDDYYLPLGAEPSTHILKPAMPEYEGVVFNEAFCLELAAACGLAAPTCAVKESSGVDYLLVERFDRESVGGETRRIHQEDFCQAMGVRSEVKYQSEGGPGLPQCFALVRCVSAAPVIDIGRLLDAVVFNTVIGNHDAHAKNFAWLRHRNGRVRMAPLYDLVCTVANPALTSSMAMRIGRARESHRVGGPDLRRLAKDCGLNPSLVLQRARELTETVIGAVDRVETPHAASRQAAAVVKHRGEQFAQRLRPDA